MELEGNVRCGIAVKTAASQQKVNGGINLKRRYISTQSVSRLYNEQYDLRARRNVNRISAYHLLWTLFICWKDELDGEIEDRGKMKGEVKRWSKKVEEEFNSYKTIIARNIKESNYPLLAEDYDELDTSIRKLCNIEQKTVISFGRLLYTLRVLMEVSEELRSKFAQIIDTTNSYCNSLLTSCNMMKKAMDKYVVCASEHIKMRETPCDVVQIIEEVTKFLFSERGN